MGKRSCFMGEQIVSKRNYGIDALRMLSMFMVVLLHILGKGGVLRSVNIFSGKYYIAWFMEIAAFCAVNCYALISGYVGINSRHRYAKIVSLWVQIIFYTLLITCCFTVFRPDTVDSAAWMRTIFPITKSHYWYLSAYFGLFFMMPLLNAAVNNLSKKELSRFLIAVLAVYGLIPNILQNDPYAMSFGYSMIWLCILYVLGAFIKRYDVFSSVGKIKALAIYSLCIMITWGSKIVISRITLNMGGEIKYSDTLVQYTSPMIEIAAIALLIFFSKLKIKADFVKKLISIFAPATLGVYIIHENFFIRNYCLYNGVKSFTNSHAIVMAIKVIATALLIYSVCSLAEIIRIKLFRLLRIDKLIARIDQIGQK